MSFDFTTLITDRTQADVARVQEVAAKIIRGTASEAEIAEWNAATMKGAYNYTDLNRVTAAIEALKAALEGYGYSVPGYKRIEIPRSDGDNAVTLTNLVSDSSFETGSWSTWGASPYDTTQAYDGAQSLKLTGDELASVPIVAPILGHKYYGREYIKTDGEVTAGDCRCEISGGDGVGLNWVFGWNQGNYPSWAMLSDLHTIEAVNASSYVFRTFMVGGVNTAWVDGLMLIDLTAAFGAGNEPDKEWCDTYIPYFEGATNFELPPRYEWCEDDIPTPEQMTIYLQNVSVIRSSLATMPSTPGVPSDMELLSFSKANAIEQILTDVHTLIQNMIAAWFYCGEVYSGEVM